MTLKRFLSVHSVISDTSGFAAIQQATINAGPIYRCIGRGSCGTIFEVPGAAVVIKYGHADPDQLWNDFMMHVRIAEAFEKLTVFELNVHVPRPYSYVNEGEKYWWTFNASRFPHQFQQNADVLISERILPLAKPIRESLIDQYCPEHRVTQAKEDPANADCLVRLYLGKRRNPRQSRSGSGDVHAHIQTFFTLRNFPLHLDQAEDLDLDIFIMASDMADALATLHWKCSIDADDVEFVLGSAPNFSSDPAVLPRDKLTTEYVERLPARSSTWDISAANFKRRRTHIWLLDFNRCNAFTKDASGVAQAVKAFFRNDPYFPRPLSSHSKDQKLWTSFQDRYIESSRLILGNDQLPSLCIANVLIEQRQRIGRRRDTESGGG